MKITPEIEKKWEEEHQLELLKLRITELEQEVESKFLYICDLLEYIKYLEDKLNDTRTSAR